MHKLYLVGALIIAAIGTGDLINLGTITVVSCDDIGPFEAFQNNSEFSFTYKLSKNSNGVVESLVAANPETNETYYTSKKSSHSLSKNAEYTVIFPLLTKAYFGKEGIKLTIDITTVTGSLFNQSITIYPIEKSAKNIVLEDIKRLESKSVVGRFEKIRPALLYDDFNFCNLDNFLSPDLYYVLDIQMFSFLYNYQKLEYQSAKVLIEDKENELKFLKHEKEYATLDLEINCNKNSINFKYKKQLYVDRLTLETSDYYIPGFVKTNNLFFPVNKREKFYDSKIQIYIGGCGYNKFDLFFDIYYLMSRELIGNCHNSDYCVRGEIE